MSYTSELESLNGLWPVFGAFVFVILLIVITCLVFYIIGMWKLFKKAGKSGWEAIIPFYNSWILVEISGLAWWWFLLLIAPTILSIIDKNLSSIGTIVSLFGSFCCYYNLSKKFHKDTGFAILTTMFSVIMIPVIGISKNYQYDSSVPVSEFGPFASKTNNQNYTTTNDTRTEETNTENNAVKFCPNCGNPVEEENEFCKNCGAKLK